MRNMKVIALSAIVTLSFAGSLFAKSWAPVEGQLLSKFTKDVKPESVLPEYPRPQMVRDNNWQNLNGLWDYAITSGDSSMPGSWDGEILVPFCVESALSGVKKTVLPSQLLWYRTNIVVDSVSGNRTLLHFGAVDWQATVFVNGKEVGQHKGNDPFTFDITSAVNNGSNEVVVKVFDPTDQGYQPRGKQVLKPSGIMYTAVTGIWQTVWLETVPVSYIESLKIVPDVDNEAVKVTVNATDYRMVQIVASYKGKEVAKKFAYAGSPAVVPVKNPVLWGAGNPELYDLKVSLLDDRKNTIDSVTSYFGMRKIEVKKDEDGINRLFLNDEVLFQYGPLDQGWWPDGLYTAPTEEAMVFDIVMTQKFGMNMIRKHVKPEPARWYYACDKLGMLVWQDMPSGATDRGQEAKDNYMNELKAMIDTLHNYPSIVMWIPFNEGWGQHDTPQVVEWLQNYDPTRPINEASGWNDRGSGDVADMHNYPGPGVRPVEDDRVCVLGEFGGLGMPAKGHLWQKDRNWGYVEFKNSTELTDAYVTLLKKMRPLIGQGLSAAVYTQTTDVEGEINGLMTYDRELVKVEIDKAAQAARELYTPAPKLVDVLPTSDKGKQTWKYTTSKPGTDWYMTTCDDSDWRTGLGGFGDSGIPSMFLGTEWTSNDIWLRKSFQVESLPSGGKATLVISARHDDSAEVYLNNKLIATLKGANGSYALEYPTVDAVKLLKKGENVIAVHCHEDGGDQFIDAGLSFIIEQ